MVSLLARTLCALSGWGHDYGLPQMKDGRYRLVCRLGCGAMSAGIQTKGMEQQAQQIVQRKVRHMNLMVVRSERTRRRA